MKCPLGLSLPVILLTKEKVSKSLIGKTNTKQNKTKNPPPMSTVFVQLGPISLQEAFIENWFYAH